MFNMQLKWYWRVLGFNKTFHLLVLDEPIQENNKWRYSVKILGYTLYWLKFKIRTKMF